MANTYIYRNGQFTKT